MLGQPVNAGVAILASAGMDASQTSFALATGYGASLPDPAVKGPFWLVVFDWTTYRAAWKDPNKEYVLVTGRSGDTVTSCQRGKQGSAAVAHNTVGKTYYAMNVFTAADAIEVPFIVEDVLPGSATYKRIAILGVDLNTKYEPGWGDNPQINPALPYSKPIGSLYVVKGVGYVDVLPTDYQDGIDRRIAVHVQRVAT
jgi:hypothetical protein